MTPEFWPLAAKTLKKNDLILARLIDLKAIPKFRVHGGAFTTLARSITGQQISVTAAESMWKKLEEKIGNVSPDSISRLNINSFRALGFSKRKVEYIKDLSTKFLDGTMDFSNWETKDDEELVEILTRNRGVGRWTAEMFLIFYMIRPNVFPLGDLGLQKAISINYSGGKPNSIRKLQILKKQWCPWCSVATWYLWRSLDPIPVEY